ncbi:MAG TPA: ParB N-terminal domain-containing protein [Propionicimonas sp.]|jgi:ParB family chromosome partitioning protein|uniref:ParB/RepB/Spo0J family partition protein n=1 Tax=Propionicimonas sp. TaxID=1955623 RepID=UPI002F3EABE1
MTENTAQAETQVTTTTSTFAGLDPRTLIIEANVRTDADLDPAFVESIRDNGVLMAILVQRHEDGTLHVRAGQRRTLGAIAAERATIPARIIDGTNDDAERIVQQVLENDARKNLTDTDRSAAYHQMALLGLPAATIARRLHKPKAEVEAGITVAASRAGLDAASQGLSLLDAAVFAEFEDDEDGTRRLRDAVRYGKPLAHAAQRIRDGPRREGQGRRPDQAPQARQGHRHPGARLLGHQPQGPERPARQGQQDAPDRRDARHLPRPRRLDRHHRRRAGRHLRLLGLQGQRQVKNTDPTKRANPMSEEDRAARREVVANNKAWKSAETVRREWLANFAKRKTAPKTAAAFIARVMIDGYTINKAREQGHRLAADMLGTTAHADHTGWHPVSETLAAQAAKAAPARAQQIALVVGLAAVEDNTHTGTWRNAYGVTRDYFAFIQECGYELSEVEALCLPGAAAADESDQATADEQDDDEADDEGEADA